MITTEPAPTGRQPRGPVPPADQLIGPECLRVASVPCDDRVRHLGPEVGPAPLWLPASLDPERLAAARFDVLHLRGGFEHRSAQQLQELVAFLRRRGTPFVFTAHDLRDPRRVARQPYDGLLDVLVPAADAVVTLTDGAAAEIRRRWGRAALVLPHPHVVDLHTMAVAQDCRARRQAAPFRLGLQIKSADTDPKRILPTLVRAVRELPDAVLQVDVDGDLLPEDGPPRDVELSDLLTGYAVRGDVELQVHHPLSDQRLWCALGALDATVLPLPFGTHSSRLEACRDLGTTVIAPTCGYLAEQGPVLTYRHDESGHDAESLATAVRTAYETRPALGASVDERRAQRRKIADAHQALYRSLLG